MASDVTINVAVTQGGTIDADLSAATVINTEVVDGGEIAASVVAGGQGLNGRVLSIAEGTGIAVDDTDPTTPSVAVTSDVFRKSADDTDDITVGSSNKFATAAEKTKLGHITVTQAVDLDTMETDIAGKQPLDADLTTIAGLDSSTAGALSTDGAGWIRKTYAQLKTALSLVKDDVGLGNVDNTSDANKPVSTAQAAADAVVQADIDAHEARTDNPHSVTKSQVGLANADNTSDANKPVSSATQTALDAKVTGPASVTDDLPAIFDGTTGKLIKSKTYAAFKTLLALVKGDVGLGNVDNTSDADKPVSTATQTALDAKQPLDSDLTTIAGLTATTDNFMVATSSAWASRTPSQARSQMGLGSIAILSTITEAEITLADNTTNDFSTTKHGFVPKGPNAGKFLKDDGTWADIPGGGDALTSNPLSQFAATTSLQLKGVLSDETGSGAAVFANSPALVTPTGIVKGDVGLGNVDNTSDATKNSATATLTGKTYSTAGSGNVLTNPYKFSAYKTGAQTVNTGGATQITFEAEEFDSNGNFASSTYTAPVAGFYFINAAVGHNAVASATRFVPEIFVNGSVAKRGSDAFTNALTGNSNVSALISLAATDTVDIRVTPVGANQACTVAQHTTYFQGFLLCHT